MNSVEQQVFKNFRDEHSRLWGHEILCLKHRLHENPLFSLDALADLIDRAPSSNWEIVNMGAAGKRHLWEYGDNGGHSGKTIIDTIANGRFWVNIRKVMDFDPRYDALLTSIFREIEDRVPSLGKTFKHNLGILISSPGAQVYYHADIPGQSLWQISGTKSVYIYPNSQPFLDPREMEAMVLGEIEEEIHYEPWMDEYAKIVELNPGDMATWPLNGPHRVVNHDCMNISVTTEHWTPAIRNSYAVHYGNGVLRRRMGVKNVSQVKSGVGLYGKAALAAVWKKLDLNKGQKFERQHTFVVDPSADNGMRRYDAVADEGAESDAQQSFAVAAE